MHTTPSDSQNRLAKETSPYLLQHANNPVDWYPWGEEALEKAKKEDKLLLISIGYSSCHWCHVMEHESFEDEEVAQLMNEKFVCIKVDREERPDVDQVYMNAVQLLSGSGGWPLNCFALPDGSPVYGGTYYPKKNWMELLNRMHEVYTKDRDKVTKQAESLKQGIQQSEFIQVNAEQETFSPALRDDFYSSFVASFDEEYGGFGQAPKFPMPGNWLFLLRYFAQTGNDDALQKTLLSIDRISSGGIYDHIGGGFSRYATDAFWNIPHFEKMLYDNGQLISLYSEAYQLTRQERYKKVVYESIQFVERELSSQDGAFYSSLDADSEGEEGKFYVWTQAELDSILGANTEFISAYFNSKKSGNWEHGKNNLFVTKTLINLADKYGLTIEEAENVLADAKEKLLLERDNRVRPGLDDKILTSWNALMIKGLTDAYRIFGEEEFLDKATIAMEFLLKNQSKKDHSLLRNHKNGKSNIPAFLDDYALLIDALINLYRATFNERWLQEADAFTQYTLKSFKDSTASMFYYTDINYSELVVRKMELADNVIPGSNSVMANNLFKLGKYLGNNAYTQMAQQMLANVIQDAGQHARYYSNWGVLLLNFVEDPGELAITGSASEALRKELEQNYLPELIVAGSAKESKLPLLEHRFNPDKSLLFVCENYSCKLPVDSVDEALELLK